MKEKEKTKPRPYKITDEVHYKIMSLRTELRLKNVNELFNRVFSNVDIKKLSKQSNGKN